MIGQGHDFDFGFTDSHEITKPLYSVGFCFYLTCCCLTADTLCAWPLLCLRVFWQDSTSRNMISKLQKCMHTSAANTMRWKFSSLYIFQRTLSPPFPLVSLVHLKVHLTPKIFFRYNNIAGKITECWLVNEESIFSLILLREEGKITRSRLVLRSPSNSSFNREVVFLQQWRLVSR